MAICGAVEFFSSIAHMEGLLDDEHEMIDEVEEYIQRQQDRIEKLKEQLEAVKAARVCNNKNNCLQR